MDKPFAPSADRNKEPILNALKTELEPEQTVLEIGSGTGQHACYFTSALPGIVWQPTELKDNIPAINSWIAEQSHDNILQPIELNVDKHPWPDIQAHVCFTSNTFHIVSLESVRAIFKGCRAVLEKGDTEAGRKLCVYGPFSIDGKHTSEGNVQFDKALRASNAVSGIRDLTELDVIAQQFGFNAYRSIQMPANNFLVVWAFSG